MYKDSILEIIKVGDILKNPKRGDSTIISITNDGIIYRRKKSKIKLSFKDFEAACNEFKGNACSTTDLKNFNSKTFDSKKSGHDCNCTFLFMIAEKINLLEDGILGKGARGSAYYVNFKE